jgi:hypothetical protein
MGTETGFMSGKSDQLLSDPRIENGYQKPTSCITCHYYAAAAVSQAQAVPPVRSVDRLDVSPTSLLKLVGTPVADALSSVDTA